MNPLHRARVPRGKCDTCREPIEPGQMYRTATRYPTPRLDHGSRVDDA